MILTNDDVAAFNCFRKIVDINIDNDISYLPVYSVSKYVIRMNIGTIMHYKSMNILQNLDRFHFYITNDLVIKYLIHHPKVTEFLYNHLKYNEYEWYSLIKKTLNTKYKYDYAHGSQRKSYQD